MTQTIDGCTRIVHKLTLLSLGLFPDGRLDPAYTVTEEGRVNDAVDATPCEHALCGPDKIPVTWAHDWSMGLVGSLHVRWCSKCAAIFHPSTPKDLT